jgi:hypothetical protein
MSLGSDFSGVDDIDSALTFLEGEEPQQIAFAQAIARRFEIPSEGLWYDPNHGLDIRTFLVDQMPSQVVEGLIQAEAKKDERCTSCSATIEKINAGTVNESWNLKIVPTATDGKTYELTMAVTTATVSLLFSRLVA